jgi:hypothetical protein
MIQNTTQSEDKVIELARANQLVEELIEIIERLDNKLEEWKEKSGCDSPDEVQWEDDSE